MSELTIPYEETEIYKVRHSLAHIMAQAVSELFEPGEAKIAIGPPIDTGFYYDFARETPFTIALTERVAPVMVLMLRKSVSAVVPVNWSKPE